MLNSEVFVIGLEKTLWRLLLWAENIPLFPLGAQTRRKQKFDYNQDWFTRTLQQHRYFPAGAAFSYSQVGIPSSYGTSLSLLSLSCLQFVEEVCLPVSSKAEVRFLFYLCNLSDTPQLEKVRKKPLSD